MPRQQHPRRRLRKAAHVLGVGTTLAITRSASASWHHALVEQRYPAYLNSPFLRARSSSSSRGNCYNNNRPVDDGSLGGSPGVLSRTPPPVVSRALTMTSDRGSGTQGRFGGGDKAHQRCPPAGTAAGRASHAASQRAGPLKATSMLLHDEPTLFGGRQPFTSHAARWFIRRAIESKANMSEALGVEVEARSNIEAMQGRFDTVSVEFRQLVFPSIQVTGGARFELLGVDLLTLGLLPGPMSRLRRLRRPCEFTATANFTDRDLTISPAIRGIAQQVVNHVVNHVLKPRSRKTSSTGGDNRRGSAQAAAASGGGGGVVVEGERGREVEQEKEQEQAQRVLISRVQVHGRKLAVEGKVLSMDPYLRFRCEFSLSTSSDGHVVRFKDPSFFWQTPNGRMPLPMPPMQPFDIDVGDRARIENLCISQGTLSVGGRFILSPVGPLRVSQGLKKSNIELDLAETLSGVICNILRFRRE